MDRAAAPAFESDRPALYDRRFTPYLILCLIVYFFLVVGMVAFGESWRAYQVIHGLWFSIYLCIIYLTFRSGLYISLISKSRWKVGTALFLLSLALHLLFFLRDPALSQDILRLEVRGRCLLDGQFPYRDFQPNKPPLYIWMVGLISLPFGPHQIVFRTVFSVLNAMIPMIMLLMGRDIDGAGRRNPSFSDPRMGFGFQAGAFIYALCPVPVLEVGLAGHFDPSVVILTLLSFWALCKDRIGISGLILGAGLSMKVYPLFLLPIFLLAIARWGGRFKFLLTFSIVPLLSAVPVLIIHPQGILEYFEYQTVEWYSGLGIMSIIEYVLNILDLPKFLGFALMSLMLFIGGSYIYVRGALTEIKRRDLDFIFAIAAFFALYLVHFTFVVLLTYTSGLAGWTLGVLIMSIAIAEFGVFAIIYLRSPPGRLKWGNISMKNVLTVSIPVDRVPLLTSAVILLLLLVSAQFHPWYMLWILPFLSWTPIYWSISLLVLFGMYQSHVYYPVDIGRF